MKTTPSAPLFQPDPDLFLADLDAATVAELFAAFATALAGRGLAHDRDALLRVLLEREAIGTTATGQGLALPHVRSHVIGATQVLDVVVLEVILDLRALVVGAPTGNQGSGVTQASQ